MWPGSTPQGEGPVNVGCWSPCRGRGSLQQGWTGWTRNLLLDCARNPVGRSLGSLEALGVGESGSEPTLAAGLPPAPPPGGLVGVFGTISVGPGAFSVRKLRTQIHQHSPSRDCARAFGHRARCVEGCSVSCSNLIWSTGVH